jgi:hypothetical protein
VQVYSTFRVIMTLAPVDHVVVQYGLHGFVEAQPTSLRGDWHTVSDLAFLPAQLIARIFVLRRSGAFLEALAVPVVAHPPDSAPLS